MWYLNRQVLVQRAYWWLTITECIQRSDMP
jgi:hypothetical protein